MGGLKNPFYQGNISRGSSKKNGKINNFSKTIGASKKKKIEKMEIKTLT